MKKVNHLTSELIMYLVKVYRRANIDKPNPFEDLIDDLKEKIIECFKIFFKNRRGVYDIEFFLPFFKQYPTLAWELIGVISDIIELARNPFQRHKLFECYKTVSTTLPELTDIEIAFSKFPIMIKTFELFCGGELKTKQVRPVLSMMNNVFLIFLKKDEERARSIISPVKEFLPPLVSNSHLSSSAPIRNLYKQTMELVTGGKFDPPPLTKKRKPVKKETKKQLKKRLKKEGILPKKSKKNFKVKKEKIKVKKE